MGCNVSRSSFVDGVMRAKLEDVGTVDETAGERAFEDLFAARFDEMVKVARLTLGRSGAGGDGVDAEDVVMDAFERVRPRLAGIDRPEAYLRTTVVNLCRSIHRRRASAPPPDRVDVVTDPEIDELWTLLGGLTADQRACLVLRFHADQSVAQIATALEMAEGTVKSHIHRGLGRLRTLIGDE